MNHHQRSQRKWPGAPGLVRRGGRPGKNMSASLLPARLNPPASSAARKSATLQNLSSPNARNPLQSNNFHLHIINPTWRTIEMEQKDRRFVRCSVCAWMGPISKGGTPCFSFVSPAGGPATPPSQYLQFSTESLHKIAKRFSSYIRLLSHAAAAANKKASKRNPPRPDASQSFLPTSASSAAA